MAKVKKLNARSVTTLKVGKHNDGGGLWLRDARAIEETADL